MAGPALMSALLARRAPGRGRIVATRLPPCGGGPPWRPHPRRWTSFISTRRNPPVLPEAVVSNPRLQAVLPYAGKVAYLTLASGFMMTDIVWLRTWLAFGYGLLTMYHALQLHPMRIPLCGSFFFFGVNAVMAAAVFHEKYMILTEEENRIFDDHFIFTMSTACFKTLMAQSQTLDLQERRTLIKAGEAADMMLILEGEAEVVLPNGDSIIVERGGLLGELSFISAGPASATVYSVPGSRYLVWSRQGLMCAIDEDPSVLAGLELKIGQEVLRKLSSGSLAPSIIRQEFPSSTKSKPLQGDALL